MNTTSNPSGKASTTAPESGVPPVPPEGSPKAVSVGVGTKHESGGLIVAMEVCDAQRMRFMPDLVGARSMLRFEGAVYSHAARMCRVYRGGFWQFWKLSNGGGYITPRIASPVTVDCDGYHGGMSANAFGLTVSLFALNELCWTASDDGRLVDLFYATRDYAIEHAERRAILSAID